MATITYIRSSGTEIEASDNPETKALAKKLGWKKKKKAKTEPAPEATPQLDLGELNA